MKAMGWVEWFLLITLSILWGGSFFFIELVVDALPPFTIVGLRVGLAAVMLHLIVRAVGLQMPWNWQLWLAFVGMGILNNAIPFSLITWGQATISSGLASILNATTPFFTIIVAHFFTQDEKITPTRFVGVLLGFIGVVLIIGPAFLHHLGVNLAAQFAILCAATSYAFAGVFGRRFKKWGISPLVTATGQVTGSTVILLPLVLVIDQPWQFAMPNWIVWSAILGLAVFSTVVAYIIYFRILAVAGATNLLLVTFLIPVSAILLGIIFLNERLDILHFIGMGFLGLGLVIVDGRLLTFSRRH